MPCTVFIDESGDTGIAKVRTKDSPGASEYFTMAAVMIQPATEIALRKKLPQLQEDFGKKKLWKHTTELTHTQRVHLCREIASHHVRCFALISRKQTLADYAKQIEWEPDKFYNKCSSYLLEMVGRYISSIGPKMHEPRIVFEERNHDYDKLIRYIGKMKDNPIYPQSKFLNSINPFSITKMKKSEETLLRVADAVSHAAYSCVNSTPDNFGVLEPRYLQELSARFACDEKGRVLGAGLKCIHKVKDVRLDKDIEKVIKDLRALPRPEAQRRSF